MFQLSTALLIAIIMPLAGTVADAVGFQASFGLLLLILLAARRGVRGDLATATRSRAGPGCDHIEFDDQASGDVVATARIDPLRPPRGGDAGGRGGLPIAVLIWSLWEDPLSVTP